jgi:endonuclease-3
MARRRSEEEAKLHTKAMKVYRRLVKTYGDHPLVPRRKPMHELISTMLSHRTTQKNEAMAFERMWEHFGSWEAIRDAPTDELVETIATANFAEVKGPNIKRALTRIIEERGEPSIDFLADMPTDEALAWLMDLPGVGIKTASLVLLFCFGKPVLPVDSHVHRVSQRLGLIGPRATPNAAHLLLPVLLPEDPHTLFNFHIDMLLHGQRVCIWANPRCGECPLTDLCDWYRENRAPGKAAERSTASTKTPRRRTARSRRRTPGG